MSESLYQRLALVGSQMTDEERQAIATVEVLFRKVGRKYKDDDLLELADQCAVLSKPVVVGDGTGVR